MFELRNSWQAVAEFGREIPVGEFELTSEVEQPHLCEGVFTEQGKPASFHQFARTKDGRRTSDIRARCSRRHRYRERRFGT